MNPAARACCGGAATTTRPGAWARAACLTAVMRRRPARRFSRPSARRNSGACACRPTWSGPTRPPTFRCRPKFAVTTSQASPTVAARQLGRARTAPGRACACVLPARPRRTRRAEQLRAPDQGACRLGLQGRTEPPTSALSAPGQGRPDATDQSAPRLSDHSRRTLAGPGISLPSQLRLPGHAISARMSAASCCSARPSRGCCPRWRRASMPTATRPSGLKSVQGAGPARHLPRLERSGGRLLRRPARSGFTGGFIPFAATRAERLANGDPRLSLEERYGTHARFVAKVREAADRLVAGRYLLKTDADRIVADAEASAVLR